MFNKINCFPTNLVNVSVQCNSHENFQYTINFYFSEINHVPCVCPRLFMWICRCLEVGAHTEARISREVVDSEEVVRRPFDDQYWSGFNDKWKSP